jgi:parallel beta-helix repeat protein
MNKKIYAVFLTLVLLLTTMTFPRNIEVTATEDYGDPGIDHGYVYGKTENLSKIVFNPIASNTSRYFGTPGERYAADLIKDWMNEIGLDCVHKEWIDAYWSLDDENSLINESLYANGWLNKSRVMQTYWINITIRNKYYPWSIVDYKYLSGTECFPFFQQHTLLGNWSQRTDQGYSISVVEDFDPGDLRQQMELANTTWTEPYEVFNISEDYNPLLLRCKGIIAIDNNTDTHFMPPPGYDQYWQSIFSSTQIFYVNGSIGTWIRNALNNPNYIVKADFYTHWEKENVTSYNIIGQINGTDPDPYNISICGAHYDNMWNQGTIDEAAETALVFGIAKYIKDHELEDKLTRTVKFIAFGGEDPGMRGAKDYIKDHIITPKKNGLPTENITYVINPGNFGHYNRSGYNYTGVFFDIPFEFASNKSWLANLAEDIADALDYTPRTNETGTGYINITPYNDLRAEDSRIFNKSGTAFASIQFGRSPFEGYHSDGVDHTNGDVLDRLDNDTFDLENEVVTSIAMHLLLDPVFTIRNCGNSIFDRDEDGNNDSVTLMFNLTSDTNTSLFCNVTGRLYNPSGQPGSYINATGFIPLILGNTSSASLDVTLLPDQPAGNYTAYLAIKDVFNNTKAICNQTVYLEAYGQPWADFTWEKLGSKNFSFIDLSLPSPGATINSWNWSFGDGYYSNVQNPYHNYSYAGGYSVTLKINDTNGKNASATEMVVVTNYLVEARFTMSSSVQKVNKAIGFTSTSSDPDGSITSATWLFGDGNTGYGNTVSHTYSSSGVYTVTLIVMDNDGATGSATNTVIIANTFANASFRGDNITAGNFTTIQAAVNNTPSGGVVYTFGGVYNESLVVNKPIYLFGEVGKAIIATTGTAVDILCNNISIAGFRVQNATTGIHLSRVSNTMIKNCCLFNNSNGVKLENVADDNIISNCDFNDNIYGVFISGSNDNLIGTSDLARVSPVSNDDSDNCFFQGNVYGVYIVGSHDNFVRGCRINASSSNSGQVQRQGIFIDNSYTNTIYSCDIFNANSYGVYISGSHDNTITNCIIKKNDKGIYLSSSSNNIIIGNNISNNNESGVNILTVSSSSNNIFFNDFICNGGNGTYPQASDSGTSNIWNTSDYNNYLYESVGEGNYWNDYTGSDSDDNGIGDTSYSISGTAGSSDYYPVMERYNWFAGWY